VIKIINNILFNESIWLVSFDIKNAYPNMPTEELIIVIDNEHEWYALICNDMQWYVKFSLHKTVLCAVDVYTSLKSVL
jgi:hypothetical protein